MSSNVAQKLLLEGYEKAKLCKTHSLVSRHGHHQPVQLHSKCIKDFLIIISQILEADEPIESTPTALPLFHSLDNKHWRLKWDSTGVLTSNSTHLCRKLSNKKNFMCVHSHVRRTCLKHVVDCCLIEHLIYIHFHFISHYAGWVIFQYISLELSEQLKETTVITLKLIKLATVFLVDFFQLNRGIVIGLTTVESFVCRVESYITQRMLLKLWSSIRNEVRLRVTWFDSGSSKATFDWCFHLKEIIIISSSYSIFTLTHY